MMPTSMAYTAAMAAAQVQAAQVCHEVIMCSRNQYSSSYGFNQIYI